MLDVFLAQGDVLPKPVSTVWDFGLAIGVITLMAVLIWRLIVIITEKMDSVASTHATTIKETIDKHAETIKETNDTHAATIVSISDKHAAERKDWNEDARLREVRITTVCDEVVKALHSRS